MILFNRDKLDMFLAVTRKYMQLRGGLAQKDLAEGLNIGISTISRFLNQKIKDVDEQLVAKIVAYLKIPLHEIIDFIDEESTERFKRLVAFYKDETTVTELYQLPEERDPGAEATSSVSAQIGRRGTKVAFQPEGEPTQHREGESTTLKEKMERLSPRQKAYLSDFLSLDTEGRDLIVDIGNSLLRYFKQKRMEL